MTGHLGYQARIMRDGRALDALASIGSREIQDTIDLIQGGASVATEVAVARQVFAYALGRSGLAVGTVAGDKARERFDNALDGAIELLTTKLGTTH